MIMYLRPVFIFLYFVFFITCFFTSCAEKSPEDNEPLGEAEIVSLDPKAIDILKQMGDFLKSHDAFEFVAEVTNEEVLDSGQKLQFDRLVEVGIRRPNKIMAEIEDVDGIKKIWYDGDTISMLGLKRNLYAKLAVAETIDETLDYLMYEYGIDLPLADFFSNEPFAGMSQFLQTGRYIGVENLRRRKCHHLAFTQESIDWQIWIEEGKNAIPRKFVITHINVQSQPQYSAIFTEWDFSPDLSDLDFEFVPPEGAHEIEFLALRNEKNKEN